MLQRKSDRHDPLTWLASLGLRPRADTLLDLMQGVDEDYRRDVMRCPHKSSGNGRDPPRAHPLGSDALPLILVGFAYFALASLGLETWTPRCLRFSSLRRGKASGRTGVLLDYASTA